MNRFSVRLARLEAHQKTEEDLRKRLTAEWKESWEQADPEHREQMTLIAASVLAESRGQEAALLVMKQAWPNMPEQELRANLERAIREYPL